MRFTRAGPANIPSESDGQPKQDEKGLEAKCLADYEGVARIAKAAHQGRGSPRPKRGSEISEGCTLSVPAGKDLVARQDEAITL